MNKELKAHQTGRAYEFRMNELSGSIQRTRKAIWASKKKIAAVEKDIAEGKRTRGCSGCIKGGIKAMTQRLADLRVTRRRVENGTISPDDTWANLRAAKKSAKKKKTANFKADEKGRVISGPPPTNFKRADGRRRP